MRTRDFNHKYVTDCKCYAVHTDQFGITQRSVIDAPLRYDLSNRAYISINNYTEELYLNEVKAVIATKIRRTN